MATSKNRVIRFVEEAFAELNKVTWPTKSQAFNLFLIVVIITILVTAYITVFDWLFAAGYKFLI